MKKRVENWITGFWDQYDRIRYAPLMTYVPAVFIAMMVLSTLSLGATLLNTVFPAIIAHLLLGGHSWKN